jgi:hypothetical protein
VLGRATSKLGLTRLTTAWTWGKPPPSPLQYTLCLSTRPTSKWHFAKVGTPATLAFHNVVCRPSFKWSLKQSCSLLQELSNDMLHATCTQGNWVNSWLLVVGNQIANLTFDFSFGHNLCFRCPNGSCEPTLDIYVPRAFQWYKELPNPMGFDSCNCSMKIQESTETPIPKMGAHLGVGMFILSHSSTLSTFREHEMWPLGFTLDSHLRNALLWLWAQG